MKSKKPGIRWIPPEEKRGALFAPFLFANHLTQYYKQIGSPKIKARPTGPGDSKRGAAGSPKGSPGPSYGSPFYGLISCRGAPQAPLFYSFFSSWVVGLMEGAGVFKITGAKKGIRRERKPEGPPPGLIDPILPAHLKIPNSYFFIQWLLFSSSFFTYKIGEKDPQGASPIQRIPAAGPPSRSRELAAPLILEFELILGPKEGATGYLLRKRLGFGSITFDRKGSVRYHVRDETRLKNLIFFLKEKGALKTLSVIGRDPGGAWGVPAIKILELGPPPRITNAKDLDNFNLDAWLSGFFETTCSFQMFHKRFKTLAGGSFGSRKKRSFGSKIGGTRHRVPRLNFSVGIGARPNSAPPFINPNWSVPGGTRLNISIEHNNKIALLIIKSYFGGHIVRTGCLPRAHRAPEKDLLLDPPFKIQNPTFSMPLRRKNSFIFKLSNTNALKKLIKILEREKLKTKKRIEFLKWSKIFFSIMESQTTSTPLTNRNKKRIKDFFLIKRDSF
uniref:Uncharacterized protein n=1 Tax=Placozoan sp. BZ10101 TaxID=401703 RepID=A2T417_9METZ|nr:hypothetical protein [Placozoan sp. BZ10101]